MTYAGAIVVLKKIKKDMFKNNSMGANALDLAIETLRKQVPKKPAPTNDRTPWKLKCPVCGTYLITLAGNTCEKCGQRLDWSDEK